MKMCLLELKFDESLISSIVIDEKTTYDEFQLNETKIVRKKNFNAYKNKDRHVRRTMLNFQKNMFPGVRFDPRGGHPVKDLEEMPKTSLSTSSSSSSSRCVTSSSSKSIFPYNFKFKKGSFPTLIIPVSTEDHVLINSIIQHYDMTKIDLKNIEDIFNEKMCLINKKLSKKRIYDDVDADEDNDDCEEDLEDDVDEDNDDCEEDLEEEVGNNNDDEDVENEDDDVEEDDEQTDKVLIIPKCAMMAAKKRSIIVSSIEDPIRKSSRNRKMNSFLTDYDVN
jgi:predicted nucleotidyltransferase component of viral defense system